MKGLILSGGKGTRLRPLTHTRAKQLIPVANKPILFYAIEALRDAGITDIGIVVGHTEEEIREAVGSGERFGVGVTYIRQEEPLGLAHAVKIAGPFLNQVPFVMYLGDNLLKDRLSDFVQSFQFSKPDAQILLTPVSCPQHFGVAELRGDRVVRLVEKPKTPPSNLALVGVYLFTPVIFEAIEILKPSLRGELEITDAIQWLIDHDKTVKSTMVSGWWKDTGKKEDLLEANRLALDHLKTEIKGSVDEKSSVSFKVVIEEGATIIRSVVRGPAIIGRNTHIENSYVGPFTSIASGCRIEESEIENSIVLEESTIMGISRIADSVIGRNVGIHQKRRRPFSNSFMLGENSEVIL